MASAPTIWRGRARTVTLASRDVTIHALESSPARGGGPCEAWWRGCRARPRHLRQRCAAATSPCRGGTGSDHPHRARLQGHLYPLPRARHRAARSAPSATSPCSAAPRPGPFDLSQAISLDKLAAAATARELEHLLLPLRAGLDDIPALSLDPDQAGSLRQGRVLTGVAADDGQHFAMLGDIPVALVEVSNREVQVVRGFNL